MLVNFLVITHIYIDGMGSALKVLYPLLTVYSSESSGVRICARKKVFGPTSVLPRLAIWLLLQARPGDFFCLIAMVCSSWVMTNAGTSRRSISLPEGNTSLAYVAAANCMASRPLN